MLKAIKEEGAATRQQQRQIATDLTQTVILASSSALDLKLQLKCPPLLKHQQILENNLKPTESLLQHLVNSDIFTVDEMKSILNDTAVLGRVKRLLIKVDDAGLEAVEALATGLRKSSGDQNFLGKLLQRTLHTDS